MLVIRRAQMDVFEEAALRSFVDLILVHLRVCYPEPIAAWSDDEVRALVRDGIDRAREYGINEGYDVCRFIECTAAYGEDFDTNPATAWAGAILRLSGPSGTARMNLIDDYEHLLVHSARPLA